MPSLTRGGMWSPLAAIVFCVVLGLLGLFQLALAAGAPLGRFAWGGGQEQLTTPYRIGSIISILIYAVFAVIAAERAGFVTLLPAPDIARIGVWVITGYMALGIFMNAISRSKPERRVMTPVALVLFATSLVVALGL
jgi:hypothetical protein